MELLIKQYLNVFLKQVVHCNSIPSAMDVTDTTPISILCLGPPNTGKTMLIKKLQKVEVIDNTYSSVPTIGTNIFRINMPEKGKNCCLYIREIGGEMSPLWRYYFNDIKKIIFVVDTSNLCQISAAGVLLYTLLAEPKLQSCKFLLVLAKMDVAYRQMRNEALLMLQMKRLQKEVRQNITILEASAINGEGIDTLHEWVTGIKKVEDLY